MKRFAAILMLALAAACGTPGPVQTYEGSPRPVAEVAILKGISAGYRAGFASYAKREVGLKVEFTRLNSFGQGYPSEVHLLPGTYLVLLNCNDGRGYAFPSVEIPVIGGMTYELGCRQPIGETRKVEAFLFRRFPTGEKN